MRAPSHSHGERGFALVELLVVILIAGILAAIALPAYLGQRLKAHDGTAKTNARTLVSELEACYHAAAGYTGCTAQLTGAETGLPIGADPGEVRITTEQPDGFVIVATSKAETGGADHTFTIVHNIGGLFEHYCTVRGAGGCPAGGDW